MGCWGGKVRSLWFVVRSQATPDARSANYKRRTTNYQPAAATIDGEPRAAGEASRVTPGALATGGPRRSTSSVTPAHLPRHAQPLSTLFFLPSVRVRASIAQDARTRICEDDLLDRVVKKQEVPSHHLACIDGEITCNFRNWHDATLRVDHTDGPRSSRDLNPVDPVRIGSSSMLRRLCDLETAEPRSGEGARFRAVSDRVPVRVRRHIRVEPLESRRHTGPRGASWPAHPLGAATRQLSGAASKALRQSER